MTEKILVPVLGESITEATISKWLKRKGDTVNADVVVFPVRSVSNLAPLVCAPISALAKPGGVLSNVWGLR